LALHHQLLNHTTIDMLQTNGVNDHMVNGTDNRESGAEVFTDYRIVGTGPAGASLACFLAQNG
jgi:hypothetical protein